MEKNVDAEGAVLPDGVADVQHVGSQKLHAVIGAVLERLPVGVDHVQRDLLLAVEEGVGDFYR